MKKIIVLILVSIATFSCGKKTDPAPTPETNTQKLCGKNWRLVAFTYNPGIPVNGVSITDFYAQLSACRRDDFQNYNVNGTTIIDEGNTKCNASDPQTSSRTWSWANNETKLTITASNTVTTLDVLQNDGNVLRLSGTEVVSGITYTRSLTYNKQ